MQDRPCSGIVLLSLLALLSPAPRLDAASGEPWRVHALKGARVVIAPGQVLPRATLVLRDGIIEAVGADIAIPPDARVWELGGKTLYAGFLDAYVPASRLGEAPKTEEARDLAGRDAEGPRETPRWPGASHPFASVRAELEIAETLKLNAEQVEKLRNLGFVAAQAVPEQGIFRGRAAVVSLGEGAVSRQMLAAASAEVVAFEEQINEFPDSLQGVIALVRQTFLDAGWQAEAARAWARRPRGRERPETNRALEALGPAARGEALVLFDALRDPLNVLRADRIGEELGLRAAVVASGGEYRRLDEVRAAGLPLVLPLDFPPVPTTGDDEEWALVSTDELRHWKRAPSNPRWLAQAGVEFALSTARLKDPAVFGERLRAAVDAGLERDQALAALTTIPAELLGVGRMLGTLEQGKVASLLVTSGDLFGEDGRIEAVWVEGRRHDTRLKPAAGAEGPAGTWLVALGRETAPPLFALELEQGPDSLEGRIVVLALGAAGRRMALDCASFEAGQLLAELDGRLLTYQGRVRIAARLEGDVLVGWFDPVDGAPSLPLRAERAGAGGTRTRKFPAPPRERPRPEGGTLAEPRALLVRGATIWTSGPAGRLENADLLVEGGRIRGLGQGLAAPPGAQVIEAAGRHLTPGLIDAHSHTAISSDVNECTQSVTAEVRIADVVDPEDWNIYSELAGGLTAANQLHGSCNSIGGQSQTIKLRWGAGSEQLKLEGARPGIKFALGENVKQSNWGDRWVVRYPQTRMGVREVIRERFLAARDYLRRQDEYRARRASDPDAIPPRRDLELDAMVEILRGERLIHCHSYRQSELLMMLDVTKEFGVTIASFQHVLDGYKVADEIAAQGVGASTFSDWWAYKFEVYDAMPWNGALMWDRGVVVSFNSDSNEQARRLNTEAAKAVKYGGLPETEALKFVTINPAMQLRIEDRTGSLEAGKDADFVIWDSHPLDATAIALETWIDGKKYFDRARDLARRGELAAERNALIAEARAAAKGKPPGGGGGGAPASPQREDLR